MSYPDPTAVYLARRRRGQCVRCSDPAAPGMSRCEKHLEQARRESLARLRRLGVRPRAARVGAGT